MLLGAVTTFLVADATGSPWTGMAAGALAGAALAAAHAFLSVSLRASQIVSGWRSSSSARACRRSSAVRSRGSRCRHRRGSVPGRHPAARGRAAARACAVQPGRRGVRDLGARRRHRLVPVPHAAGPVPALGGGVAGDRRRDGAAGERDPLRPHHRGWAPVRAAGAYLMLAGSRRGRRPRRRTASASSRSRSWCSHRGVRGEPCSARTSSASRCVRTSRSRPRA
jgi:hypothetical protein